MEKHRRKTDEHHQPRAYKRYIHVFIIAITFICILSVFNLTLSLNKNVINSEKNSTFDHPWSYSIDQGHEQTVNLPYNEQSEIKSQIVLRNQLPQEIIKGITLLLRTSQQSVRVFVENELIYNSQGFGELPSSAYHFVRLPTNSSGKNIAVELTSPHNLYAGRMNDILIGSKASNIFYVLSQGSLQFTIGASVFIVGFLLSIIFLFTRKHSQLIGIIYLGLFFLCAGFWVMVESRLLQFAIPYPATLTNVSILTLTLLPLFSSLYYFSMHEQRHRYIEAIFTVITSMIPLSMAILALVNPVASISYLPVYLIYLGIYILAISANIFFNKVKGMKKLSIPMIGIIIFFLSGVVELTQYFTHMKDYSASNFMMFGLFIFCLVMFSDLLISFSKAYSASIRVNALTVLAYTDSLTGVYNRTAFLETMTNMKRKNELRITVFMFDINNLKPVNDTLGHLIGDALIKHSVQVILSCLRSDDELYRIGGDEFVAILKHGDDFNPKIICERMEKTLVIEQKKTKVYDLNIAYGFAQYDEKLDDSLFKTLERADEAMYLCKKQQKELEKGVVHNEK